MRLRAALVAAAAGGAFALADAWGAASAPVGAQIRHVLVHVCDCPGTLAGAERLALLAAFKKLGYSQGVNLDLITYDYYQVADALPPGPMYRKRQRDAEAERPPASAPPRNEYVDFFKQQVLKRQPQLILASGGRVAEGAKAAGSNTPIVFWRVTDPIAFGFVESFARPGGNLTGFSRGIERLTVKRLELLQQMLPKATRVTFLYIDDNPHHVKQAEELRMAAEGRRLSISYLGLPLREWSVPRLEEIFAGLRKDGMDAFLLPDTNVQGQVVVELAARYRLPTIHALSHVVTEWGGLAAYTTLPSDELEGVAKYAVRILKGERPRDLPVQEPVEYELVLNARAARAMDLEIPPVFMLRATKVIEK